MSGDTSNILANLFCGSIVFFILAFALYAMYDGIKKAQLVAIQKAAIAPKPQTLAESIATHITTQMKEISIPTYKNCRYCGAGLGDKDECPKCGAPVTYPG